MSRALTQLSSAFLPLSCHCCYLIHVVRHHIQTTNALWRWFQSFGVWQLKEPIALGRSDEWSHLEKAYNDMAGRLSEAYLDLTEEKKELSTFLPTTIR
ncbi:hypothetical protein OK016_21735 [Vibrio chagasii]|nr:hypothetical protein [Vibrio chagasii]